MIARYFVVAALTESNALPVGVGYGSETVLALVIFIVVVGAAIALGYTMYTERPGK